MVDWNSARQSARERYQKEMQCRRMKADPHSPVARLGASDPYSAVSVRLSEDRSIDRPSQSR